MDYSINNTTQYHVSDRVNLGWELTVCNALFPPESPCRSVLKRKDSYGSLLFDYLDSRASLSGMRAIIEIGGGYGYLMRDFLERNAAFRATMLDISPRLLARQRETLSGYDVSYIEGDFHEISEDFLRRFEVAIMNETLGDFPSLVGLQQDLFFLSMTDLDEPLRRARHYFERYDFPHPEAPSFHFNIGAMQAVEKLCAASVAVIFLGEHSCEASVPESFKRVAAVSAPGYPERIRLAGHDEYTIKFSNLEAVGGAFGYRVIRGPFADFLEIDFTDKLRSILSAPSAAGDYHEIISHFVSDLFQYEYLILTKDDATPSGDAESGGPQTACHRCGKCCYTDFIAYVTDEDRRRWAREQRQDILGIIEHAHAVWVGDHLISAENGRYLRCCPFLAWEGGLHACTIYETRPAQCRNFVPGSSEICPQWSKY